MTRSPSFQFYPADWTSGAPATMTPEETHVYLWLLCLDWLKGGFVFDLKDLARWCRLTRPRFTKAWSGIRENFVERDGRFYNPRLEKERAKQAEWRAKSSEGGKAGAKSRWSPNDDHRHKDGHKMVKGVVTPSDDTSVFSLQSSSSDPVTDSSSSAREGRVLLLEVLGPTQRNAMSASLDVMAQGYQLPNDAPKRAPTPAEFDRACRECAASVPAGQITARVVGGYLGRVMRGESEPAKPRSAKPTSFTELVAARAARGAS